MKEIIGNYAKAKVFTDDVEAYAETQIKMICDNPVSQGSKIRVMPDVHPGQVGTIGLTMTVGERILPNLLGVDIGCGVTCALVKGKQMELLRVCNLKKSYDIENSRTMKKEKTEVLKEISLSIAEEEALCIMGRSGCGKTTLLKILGGLLVPTAGSVFYKGERMSGYGRKRMEAYRRAQVGFVFQDYICF